jgi:hypothetical protein
MHQTEGHINHFRCKQAGNMKKAILYSLFLTLILILSIGIIDSLLALNEDINNHLWISLIGRWRSYETVFYEMEFQPDGTFYEYYHGVIKNSGVFQTNNNSIMLTFDPSSCDREIFEDCTVTMKYNFDMNTLILISNDNRMSFQRNIGT